MQKKIFRFLLVVLFLGYALFSLKDFFIPSALPYIEKKEEELISLLKKNLGLPKIIETSPKVPKVVFIDRVIPHNLIRKLPQYQLDSACYDTLDTKDHLIPRFFKKQGFIIFPSPKERKQEENHCYLMVKGFLDIAGEADHCLYLPSNSPDDLEDDFVVPSPQWDKVIKRLEKGERFDIINCSYSYGSEIYPHESYDAIKRGSLVIVSAGNEYDKEASIYKANFVKLSRLAREMNAKREKGAMLVVGAYNPFTHTLVDYSNRPFDELSGLDFVSAPCFYRKGNRAYLTGGTSIAAAYVTGVAALLMKKFPTFTAQEIVSLLKASADPVTGLINYEKAAEWGHRMKKISLFPPLRF